MRKGISRCFICVMIVLVGLIVVVETYENNQMEKYSNWENHIEIEYEEFSDLINKQLDGKSVSFEEVDSLRRNIQRFILGYMEDLENSYGNQSEKIRELELLNSDINDLWENIMNSYYLKETPEKTVSADEILEKKNLIDDQIKEIAD